MNANIYRIAKMIKSVHIKGDLILEWFDDERAKRD